VTQVLLLRGRAVATSGRLGACPRLGCCSGTICWQWHHGNTPCACQGAGRSPESVQRASLA
jgi:hypothetical protein